MGSRRPSRRKSSTLVKGRRNITPNNQTVSPPPSPSASAEDASYKLPCGGVPTLVGKEKNSANEKGGLAEKGEKKPYWYQIRGRGTIQLRPAQRKISGQARGDAKNNPLPSKPRWKCRRAGLDVRQTKAKITLPIAYSRNEPSTSERRVDKNHKKEGPRTKGGDVRQSKWKE